MARTAPTSQRDFLKLGGFISSFLLSLLLILSACRSTPTAPSIFMPTSTSIPANIPTPTAKATSVSLTPELATPTNGAVEGSISEQKPNAEPVWTDGRYFPRFPSTDLIYVFRLPAPLADFTHGAVKKHWRVNQSDDVMTGVTLVGMQGVINRSKPRVYIEWYDPLFPELFTEISWVPLLEEHVEVIQMDLDSLNTVDFLLQRYGSWFSGIVIYDPDVPDTINLATMIAGLEDRIMLAPEQMELPGIAEYSSVTDLRQLVRDQGWDDSEESKHRIYQWVYDNLWPHLEHRMIYIVSPGPPTSREREFSPGDYYQLDLTPRDYLIALRLPALWLSPVDEPDETLLNLFLEEAPSPIPISGVFASMEHETVKIVSEHGDFMTGMNWPGGWIATGNLSVLSAVRPDIIKYDREIDQNSILTTIGASHVATLVSSDGDAIYYLLGRGFGPRFGWDYVQNQRFGWTISPLLSELAPVLWNYYVNSRSEVSLLAGVSGVGYVEPEFMDDSELDQYLEYSARYLAETGIRTINVSCHYFMTREIMARYYDKLRESGYLGAFPGWFFSHNNLAFSYPGVPAPAVWSRYLPVSDSNLMEIVNSILSDSNNVFIDMASSLFHRGTVVEDSDAYGGKSVQIPQDFVSGNDPAVVDLFYMGLLPGDYQVKIRLKVADNQSENRVARLNIHHPETSQQSLYLDIRPSDFLEANRYQDFTFPLSLIRMTDEFRIEIVVDSGLVDLYIDTIEIQRDPPIDFPYFASIGIDNIGDASAGVPGRFVAEFENRGGIVLHPDEFSAALNPEYMIEMAIPLIGSEHPAILEARRQLEVGEYFNSLMTIRDALRVYLEHQRSN
jgi:hypothetical protein